VSFGSASHAKDAAPERRSGEGGPVLSLNELRRGKALSSAKPIACAVNNIR
jgi:hypothetical protein